MLRLEQNGIMATLVATSMAKQWTFGKHFMDVSDNSQALRYHHNLPIAIATLRYHHNLPNASRKRTVALVGMQAIC